ncbi:paxillin homolog 1 [Lepeophtheirus salmonis]|uniref:paxillin homolog 1 n=1 Tax=Lepeophtheirus salmonis TaxID=72036 RepID=UPI001AEABAC3|nr:zyxin-like [Lepeophtheirus salmonis]
MSSNIQRNSLNSMTEVDLDFLTDRLVDALNSGRIIHDEESSVSNTKKCDKCDKGIEEGKIVMDKEKNYHWDCFTCYHCSKPIGGETYFVGKDKNSCEARYCKEHRDVLLDTCTKCGDFIRDDLIKPGDKGSQYHPQCFVCSDCGEKIAGKFFLCNDGTYMCEKDYAKSCAYCSVCSKPILYAHLNALNRSYHPECFACHFCNRTLDGVQAFYTDDLIICKEDYEKRYAQTCEKCEKKILDETIIKTEDDIYYHKLCYYEDS